MIDIRKKGLAGLAFLVSLALMAGAGCAEVSSPIVAAPEPAHAPAEADSGSRIVYTTDAGSDQAPFIEDCARRGGRFNECGSPCEPSPDMVCMAVCAYTCEDIPHDP